MLLNLPEAGVMKTIYSGRHLDSRVTAPYICENEVAAELPVEHVLSL